MKALDLLASLRLEDDRRWGDVATPWQWQDARAILDPGPNDPRLHFVTRARGGSKTTDLAAVAAAVLVDLPPGGRVYAVAVDRTQSRLLVDALAGLVGRTPGLSSAISVDRFVATAASGARLEVLAADEASAYGLRGEVFIVDELTQWAPAGRGMWTAIVSAVPKVAGCRLVVLASAGDPAHWSYGVRERARTSPAWRLHEVPGPVPWVSPEALAEQRALLTDSQYARLHLNLWTASEDRLASLEDIGAALRLAGPSPYQPGVRYRVGCDLGLTHDRTAIAVCHAEAVVGEGRARRVVLDRLLVFAGSKGHPVELAEVEAALFEVWRAYGHPRIRMTPWQGVQLAQRLRGRGVGVEEWSYSPQRYGGMASVLFALLRDHLLDLYDAPGLVDELANVRLRETTPGQVRVTHDPGRHDDRVVALGMAALALVEEGVPGPARALTAETVVPRLSGVHAAVPGFVRRLARHRGALVDPTHYTRPGQR